MRLCIKASFANLLGLGEIIAHLGVDVLADPIHCQVLVEDLAHEDKALGAALSRYCGHGRSKNQGERKNKAHHDHLRINHFLPIVYQRLGMAPAACNPLALPHTLL